MKVETLPSMAEASLWSSFRLNGGPMSEAEYNSLSKNCGQDSADRLLTLKARTTIAWFAADCFSWLTFWDIEEFEQNKAASDAWA